MRVTAELIKYNAKKKPISYNEEAVYGVLALYRVEKTLVNDDYGDELAWKQKEKLTETEMFLLDDGEPREWMLHFGNYTWLYQTSTRHIYLCNGYIKL